MLDALRFVASAVAKKDFVPELTHFKIKGGRVTGFNGQVALSSPIDVDLDVQPKGIELINAIRACPETIALNVTGAGRLAVRSGKFRAFVPCLPEEVAHFVVPEGVEVELGPNFMEGIKQVAPIMGIDASRAWSMGIKLQRQSMFATNNVMLVEYWHGADIPVDVVIPALAVHELLRIGETPKRVQVNDNSISFWFAGDRWLRTQLLVGGSWPTDKIGAILDASTGPQTPLPPSFGEAIAQLKPFLGERGAIFITPEQLSTSQHDGEGAQADYALPGVTDMQAYHHKQLELLALVASTVDWTAYPRPCKFMGGQRLRGALVGQRV